MKIRKAVAATLLTGVSVLGATGAAYASGNNNVPSVSPSSSTSPSASSDSTQQHHRDGRRGHHSEVTGAEKTKVVDAAKAKYPGITVDKVLKDSDGSYDVLATKGTQRLMVEVSKDLTTVTEHKGGPHGGPGDRDGRHGMMRGTEVTGATKAKVVAAAQAKYPGITVDHVFQSRGGEYHVLATKGSTRMMIEVSKDLKTVTEHKGGPHGGPGDHRPGGPMPKGGAGTQQNGSTSGSSTNPTSIPSTSGTAA